MKRTYQPSKLVRKRRHGFRARMATKGGRRVVARAARADASGSAPDGRRGTTGVVAMERLRQRADFLAAATGAKVPTTAFVLQARKRDDHGPVRVGFTVSRKVGTAVERNRRAAASEIVRLSAATGLSAGHDYVLIGRRAALSLPFEQITEDYKRALRRLRVPNERLGQNTILAIVLSALS